MLCVILQGIILYLCDVSGLVKFFLCMIHGRYCMLYSEKNIMMNVAL